MEERVVVSHECPRGILGWNKPYAGDVISISDIIMEVGG